MKESQVRFEAQVVQLVRIMEEHVLSHLDRLVYLEGGVLKNLGITSRVSQESSMGKKKEPQKGPSARDNFPDSKFPATNVRPLE